MYATHRVKNSVGETVGFIIENEFYNNYSVLNLVKSNLIENLIYYKSGRDIRFRASNKLPVVYYKDKVLKPLYIDLIKKNPIQRDIQLDLTNWKNTINKKVLRLDGPRQTGKTTEIKKFAYLNYEVVIYVNLSMDKFNFYNLTLNNNISPNLMKNYCELAGLPNYINSDKTLLIIDEIQISSKIYNQIREFKENLNCDIIVTGSYLGQILNKDYFHPMGTVSILKMFPLSFSEFVNVFEKRENLKKLSLIGLSLSNEYDILEKLYDLYLKIGGYPSVVYRYLCHNNLNMCYEELKNILKVFKEESNAYFDNPRMVNIFNEVYRSLLLKITFEKKGIDSGKDYVSDLSDFVHKNSKNIISRDEINNSINWIIRSGILNICDLYLDGDYLNVISARRLYFIDCGLLNYLGNLYALNKSNLSGLITETFVYNELLRRYTNNISYLAGDYPAFSTFGSYELDFMIVVQSLTKFGLEIKSSTGQHKSLDLYKQKGFIDKKIVAKLTHGGYNSDNKILTVPVYTIGERLEDILNFNFV